MPSPTVMKKRSQQLDKTVAMSDAERAKLKEGKNKGKEEDASPFGPWVLAFILFVVLGSSLLQIYYNIMHSPSMSEEH